MANLAWVGSSLPAWLRFRAALADPLPAQAALLTGSLQRNQDTLVGRELGFGAMLAAARRSTDPGRALIDVYRARIPLRGYDDLEPYIRRIRSGDPNILTADPVCRLVPSSGSTAARKLLPLTPGLRREFARAVSPWIADLHLTHRGAAGGRAYWSISPALRQDAQDAVPIGFDDDSEYLGRTANALARAVLAVPDAISRVTDPDAFRYLSLLFLVRARDLRLISVWHPSFLERLLDSLPAWMPRIAGDIALGTLSPPGTVAPDVLAALARRMHPDPRRARELERFASLETFEPRRLWPDLAVVSCWADGAAAPHADRLARALPAVAIQGKGLVATEGIVSIPFGGARPLAILSHFFEFIDEAGEPRLAHELEEGAEYSVALTTAGGLYRYRLGDRIVVNGRVRRTPSIGFIGKDDRISDLFGEKLSDGFVAGVLARLFDGGPAPRFAMLAPAPAEPARDPGEASGATREPGNPATDGLAYTLFVEIDRDVSELAARLERELRRNPHYAWCVDLGQLRPARVVRVGPHADRAYVDACLARGSRLGDIKPAALDRRTDWHTVFK